MKSEINFITSIKNPAIEQARALTSFKGRKVLKKLLLEGKEHIEWALSEGISIECVFFESKELENPFVAKLLQHDILCYSTPASILKKISDTSFVIPFVGVATIPQETFLDSTRNDFIVVLDHLKDHGNIGTIVRSAHAFGITNVVMVAPDIDLFYKKIIDASRGKVLSTKTHSFDTSIVAINELKKAGYQIIATSPRGSSVQSIAALKKNPIALFIGNETEGLSDEVIKHADSIIQIPMSSEVESLNAAVFAGISIYELKMKLVLAMLQEKIKATLGRNLNVASKMVQQVFDARTKQLTGLSNLQTILLMILKCDQFMTYAQASKDTVLFGDELQVFLQPLFDQGLIQKSGKDGIEGFELTYRGEEFLAKVWLLQEKDEAEILTGFSEDEKKQLDTFLARIQQNCEKLME